jgi:hypothetical protein
MPYTVVRPNYKLNCVWCTVELKVIGNLECRIKFYREKNRGTSSIQLNILILQLTVCSCFCSSYCTPPNPPFVPPIAPGPACFCSCSTSCSCFCYSCTSCMLLLLFLPHILFLILFLLHSGLALAFAVPHFLLLLIRLLNPSGTLPVFLLLLSLSFSIIFIPAFLQHFPTLQLLILRLDKAPCHPLCLRGRLDIAALTRGECAPDKAPDPLVQIQQCCQIPASLHGRLYPKPRPLGDTSLSANFSISQPIKICNSN